MQQLVLILFSPILCCCYCCPTDNRGTCYNFKGLKTAKCDPSIEQCFYNICSHSKLQRTITQLKTVIAEVDCSTSCHNKQKYFCHTFYRKVGLF